MGRYVPKLSTIMNPGLAGPRPLDLVPFWKPPNITERTTRSTISSRIHSRQQVYILAQQKIETAARQSQRARATPVYALALVMQRSPRNAPRQDTA